MEAEARSTAAISALPKDHSTPKISGHGLHRKHLQTLQHSAHGDDLNGGKICPVLNAETVDGKSKLKICHDSNLFTTTLSLQPVKVYEDRSALENSCPSRCTRLIQTDDSLLEDLVLEKVQQNLSNGDDSGKESGYISQEGYDLMVKDEISENYWKELAEERRRALKETLAENEKLSIENEKLTTENWRLSGLINKYQAMQELLQDILSDDEENEDKEEQETSDVLTLGRDQLSGSITGEDKKTNQNPDQIRTDDQSPQEDARVDHDLQRSTEVTPIHSQPDRYI